MTAHAPRASVIALVLALLINLLLPSPSHATPLLALDPHAVTAIEIHKFQQPDRLGEPANGLPQDTTGLTPVPGAGFTAKRVPGIDLTTNAGQNAAAMLTAPDAGARVASEPVAASGTTDALGNATLAPLGVGLYYVEETMVPAGYLGSVPFLVALPLTDPVTRDTWLTTVHVYPKNSQLGVGLAVSDRDAVALGDTVGWVSSSDIPLGRALDGYRVVQRIDARLRLIDSGDHITVGFDVPGAPALVLGTHYTRTIDPVTGQMSIDFLQAGLGVLEQVSLADPGARLRIGYRTTVLGDGVLANEALLYPSRASIDGAPGAPPPATATNATKWGPIAVRVHERGNPGNLIPGVRFKLYLTPEDAVAGRNPVTVDGASEWSSDAQGLLQVPGVRFSGFVDGLDRAPNDPLYRSYFVMPVGFPAGWTGEQSPMLTSVDSTVDPQVLTAVVWRTSGPTPQDLALTGSRAAGAALISALLLGVGATLVIRRRRDRSTDAADA